jgi:hypothetical protein
VFIDDRHNLDRSPVGGEVELEVDGPQGVWIVSARSRDGDRGAAAFAPPPLRHPQTLIAPQSLDLLVIDDPALAAGIVAGGPKPATRMSASVGAQPRPQSGIRILRRDRGGFVSLGGSVLPGHAAREAFADPQHPLEVTNGRPPAFRA